MIKRGKDDVEQVYIETLGGKGKMYITQLMGKDAALPDVDGFPDDFDSSRQCIHELI